MEVVPSTYHQYLKIYTLEGVKILMGDQKMSQICYMTSCKLSIKPKEINMIATNVEEEILTIKDPPIKDEIDSVCIDELKPDRIVNIGAKLQTPVRQIKY